mmetsp:Transcript_36737/g.86899  ORF Transcript_36737/g.86899 Transcript_36737/m.86899 type:complete len:223 (+) Transcript_36737:375-1043(+)
MRHVRGYALGAAAADNEGRARDRHETQGHHVDEQRRRTGSSSLLRAPPSGGRLRPRCVGVRARGRAAVDDEVERPEAPRKLVHEAPRPAERPSRRRRTRAPASSLAAAIVGLPVLAAHSSSRREAFVRRRLRHVLHANHSGRARPNRHCPAATSAAATAPAADLVVRSTRWTPSRVRRAEDLQEVRQAGGVQEPRVELRAPLPSRAAPPDERIRERHRLTQP